jgi:hypothetical protein
VRFLLGTSPEAERADIERECLHAERTTFDELIAVEDELRVDYAQGRLSPEDCRRFEERFLATAAGREKQAFANALAATIRPLPTSQERARTSRIRPAVAAAAAVIIVLWSAALLVERQRLQVELQQVRQELTSVQRELEATLARRQPPAAPSGAEPSQPAPSPVVALSLTPLLTRSGSESVPAAAASDAARGLRLDLQLPPGAPRHDHYVVAITDPDGRAVWTGTADRSADGAIATVPSALAANDYQADVKISSSDPVGIATYAFRITR